MDLPPAEVGARVSAGAHGRRRVVRPASSSSSAAQQDTFEDSLAVQSFKKHAETLDRHRDSAKAHHVREMAAEHERRRSDRMLR